MDPPCPRSLGDGYESTPAERRAEPRAADDAFEDDRAHAAGLGFTDVVNRPTRRAADLRPGELEHGGPSLERRLTELGIEKIIFTYKAAATRLSGAFAGFGLRPGRRLAGAEVFVMCGPMAPRADRYVTDPAGYLWKVASSKRRPLIARKAPSADRGGDDGAVKTKSREVPITIGLAV